MNAAQSNNEQILIAESLIEKRLYQEAESVLLYILDSDPDNIEARIDLSAACILMNKTDEAIRQINYILECEPDNEIALSNLDYIKSGNLENLPDGLEVRFVNSYNDYLDSNKSNTRLLRNRALLEGKYIKNGSAFFINAYCCICGRNHDFELIKNAAVANPLDWGDNLVCPQCKASQKVRGFIQIAGDVFNIYKENPVAYSGSNNILENYFSKSEAAPPYHNLLSLDHLAYSDNYQLVIKQLYDSLQKDGLLLLHVPFDFSVKEHKTVQNKEGKLETIFGWNLLDDLSNTGFKHVNATLFWSRFNGYFGNNIIISAKKRVERNNNKSESKINEAFHIPSDCRESIIIYSNCQGGWFYQKLQFVKGLKDNFNIIYLPNFAHPTMHPTQKDFELVKKCKYIILQTSAMNKDFAYNDDLPADCSIIKVPALFNKLLWPFNQSDSRSKVEEGFPFGRFPYGDSILNELMAQNLKPEEIVKIYMELDFEKRIDLTRYEELFWEEIEYTDTFSDIKVYPYMQRYFPDESMFDTINHPVKKTMWNIYKPVEDYILLASGLPTEATDPRLYDFEIGDVQIPIHPFLLKHFKLRWAGKNAKFRFRNSLLTFEEYLYKYISFEKIN